MIWYNATAALDTTVNPSDAQLDDMMDVLVKHSGAVGFAPDGSLSMRFSLQAGSQKDAEKTAAKTAGAVFKAGKVPADKPKITVITEDEFLKQEGISNS